MGEVTNLVPNVSPTKKLSEFFERIYGRQRGYAYVPTKEVGGKEKWTKKFFEWPKEKEELVEYVLQFTVSHEVYYSPALYSSPANFPTKITTDIWYGSNFVWAEFDYGLPSNKTLAELNIPLPSIRVRTSLKTKEHWYWRLSEFCTDQQRLTEITKRLAYHLDADLSGWDYQQVLRPPGTIHHKSQVTTQLISRQDNFFDISVFESLPELGFAPRADIKLGLIPKHWDVIFKYPFKSDFAELYQKDVDDLEIKEGAVKPDRSDALMRVGWECAEMGMSDEEMYSMLKFADERWRKFTDTTGIQDAKNISRKPDPERQKKNFLRIINRTRTKYPLPQADDLSEFLPIFGFKSLLAADVQIEWVIEGLLQRNGFLVISGPPDSGKTQLSLWIAIHLALGKPVFGWKAEKPLKIMFVSMEMPHADLKKILEQMGLNFTPEEIDILEENFIGIPLGHSVYLDKVAGQKKINDALDKMKPDGIMFDSLGVAIGEDISKDTVIKDTFQYVNIEIRKKRECFVWFIHHGRKAQIGNRQPKELADLYGSMYIGAQASTVLGVWPIIKGKTLELNYLKTRMTPVIANPRISRTQPLGFKLDDIHAEENIVSALTGFANKTDKTNDAATGGIDEDDTFDLE